VLCDRFQVIRFIAKGGMGEVYEVEDRHLRGVHVALKTVLSQYAADPLMQERFEREVLNAREVVHPNICPIYDIFHWKRPEGRLTFLTMKLLAGETLSARLGRAGPIAEPEASLIICQVGAGLSAAHQAGILHRDIKAANIILDGSGEKVDACVTDFGLARAALGETTALTLQGIAGTPGYMAPELFYGGIPSTASDVFSFGVVVYQVLTSRMPKLSPVRSADNTVSALTQGLPPKWRQLVGGCLEPNPELRFKDIRGALQSLGHAPIERKGSRLGSRLLTRRKMITLTATGCLAAAGGAWLERDRLVDLFEPLPEKRFVALMAWPAGDSTSVVRTILDSIGNRLARAEAYVKDLLVVSARDVPTGGVSLTAPNKSEISLGANLVLAAWLQQTSSIAHLRLQLLDAGSQRVLRSTILSCPVAEIAGLTQQAAERAAILLRLPHQEKLVSDTEELRSVPQDVMQAYSEAEELVDQSNHSGLQQAISKYEHALDLDPHFALGYAKLAIAFLTQYLVTREAANVDLAQKNASKALQFNPNSSMGLMSQALIYLYTGKNMDAMAFFAKALNVDPGNPRILNAKAAALKNTGRLAEAAQVYREVLSERPNYWQAYNNLGTTLQRQAKYEEAAKAFADSAMTAPNVALPMANLGATYIDLGKLDEARTALAESLKRDPNVDAYLALGDLDFHSKKYDSALRYYEQAGGLEPSYDLIQRNMGDCYEMLGNPKMVTLSYQRAARLLSNALSLNPQNGNGWATLAFYDAKVGNRDGAESDIRKADEFGAKDVESRFLITQALALMGRKEDALKLLLWCIDNGLSRQEVDLAIDLKEFLHDPNYLSHLKGQTDRKASSK
jgi:serine/threonine protein kinase/Tfp pilus assembly protein PilF